LEDRKPKIIVKYVVRAFVPVSSHVEDRKAREHRNVGGGKGTNLLFYL
jgi:hypothetical protein